MYDWTRLDTTGFRNLVLKGDYTAPSKLLYNTPNEQVERACTPTSAKHYAKVAMAQEEQVRYII